MQFIFVLPVKTSRCFVRQDIDIPFFFLSSSSFYNFVLLLFVVFLLAFFVKRCEWYTDLLFGKYHMFLDSCCCFVFFVGGFCFIFLYDNDLCCRLRQMWERDTDNICLFSDTLGTFSVMVFIGVGHLDMKKVAGCRFLGDLKNAIHFVYDIDL